MQGARGGRDIVQRLSHYVGRKPEKPGRAGSGGPGPGHLLRSLHRMMASMGEPNNAQARMEMVLELERSLTVQGVGGELTEVFLNLAKNAMEAMPRGGKLAIDGRVENDQMVVTFADQGPGVDEETLGPLLRALLIHQEGAPTRAWGSR